MSRRIQDIELLRGLAVLFVLFEHTRINLIGQPSQALDFIYTHVGCWTGVDLFFAISGFVIARDLLPRLQRSDGVAAFFITARNFWIRRAWRLWPSAWFWLALLLLATMICNRSGVFSSFSINLDGSLAGLLNYANFRMMLKFGREELGPTFPYWSLSLEEQFYVLLPLMVWFCRRWLVSVLLVLVLLQFFSSRHDSLLLMLTRSDALLLGVLLAIWSKHSSYRQYQPTWLQHRGWARYLVLLGLITGLAVIGSQQWQHVRLWVGIVALVAVVLVWVASYDRDYLMSDNAFKRALLWVGSRSYALYLTHIPAYLLSREIWYRITPVGTVFDVTYNVRLVITALLLVLLFSELNYRLIETPMRAYGKKMVDKMEQGSFRLQVVNRF